MYPRILDEIFNYRDDPLHKGIYMVVNWMWSALQSLLKGKTIYPWSITSVNKKIQTDLTFLFSFRILILSG